MANVQDMKAQKAEKTLRLLTVLLLVVGIVTLAVSIFDMVSGFSLLKLFDAKAAETAEATAEAVDPNQGGQTVAYILLTVAAMLLIFGSITHLWKKNYRTFQGTCVAAIIFALFPLIFFAVNIGSHLFALIHTLLALAIIVLAIFAMKSRWQVYIKEMTGEVKKLTWLNMKELVKATAVVLVFVIAFALLIFVLDLIFYTPVKALLSSQSQSATTDEEPIELPEVGDTTEGMENNG